MALQFLLPFQIYKSAVEGHDSFLFADMISGEYDHAVYANVQYDDEPIFYLMQKSVIS